MSTVADQEKQFIRALELDEVGRTAEALKLLVPIVAARHNPRHLLAFSMMLDREGRVPEAIAAVRDALSIQPPYSEGESRLFLADMLLRLGRKAEAIQEWRIVAKMKPTATAYGAVPDEAILRLQQHEG